MTQSKKRPKARQEATATYLVTIYLLVSPLPGSPCAALLQVAYAKFVKALTLANILTVLCCCSCVVRTGQV